MDQNTTEIDEHSNDKAPIVDNANSDQVHTKIEVVTHIVTHMNLVKDKITWLINTSC